MGTAAIPPAAKSAPTASAPSLFGDDYLYVREALNSLRKASPREHNPVESDDAKRTLGARPQLS